jgi:asparagine synthetase B (glutamine-hydrolysing)
VGRFAVHVVGRLKARFFGESGLFDMGTIFPHHDRLLLQIGVDEPTLDHRAYLRVAGESSGLAAVHRFLQSVYLVQNGLQLSDKLGSGQSIEIRVPFVSPQVFEAASRLSLKQRIQGAQSKPILRQILRGRIPEAIRIGAKRGFTPPFDPIIQAVRAHLPSVLGSSLVADHFDTQALRTHAAQWESDPSKHGIWTWFLFALISCRLSQQYWT